MTVTPHDPSGFGLPSGAVELTAARTQDSATFRLPDGRAVTVIASDLHYQDAAGDWQPVDLTLGDADDPAFSDAVSRAKYRLLQSPDGRRRICPRRNVPDEWIEFGALQARPGASWQTIPWSSRERSGNTLTLERPNAALTVTLDGNRVKVSIILKDASAAAPLRWPVSLHGLSRSGWSLIADSDGATVATIEPLSLVDAVGTERPVTASVVGGAVQFTANVSGLVYPVTIDPTTTFQVGASTDDGYVTLGSPSYPPSGTGTVFNGSQIISASRTKGTPNYVINTGVLFFNTAPLGNSTPTSATLRLWITGINDAGVDDRNLVMGWYAGGNRPVDASDWTATPETDAHAGTNLTDITVNASNDFALQNLGSINTSGYTGIRLHVDGGQPLGVNQVIFSSFDQATNPKPQLIVTSTPNYDTYEGSVTLSGASSLSPATITTLSGAVTLGASGALGSAAVNQPQGSATANAGASLSAAGVRTTLAEVALTGDNALTADWRAVKLGAVTLSGASTLTPTAVNLAVGTATATAGSGLSGAGTATTSGAASLSAVSELAPVSFSVLASLATFTAASNLQPNGAGIATGAGLTGRLRTSGGRGLTTAGGGSGRTRAGGTSGLTRTEE